MKELVSKLGRRKHRSLPVVRYLCQAIQVLYTHCPSGLRNVIVRLSQDMIQDEGLSYTGIV